MARLLLLPPLLLLLSTITTCSATTYIVGGNSGWDISTDLQTWVQDKKFYVGDVLVFQYSSSNSVDEVTKENFQTCNTSKVLAAYANGNTTVPLTKPGDRYFVCGNKLLCLGGMKLHVHVEGDSTAYSPASAPKAAAGSDEGAAALPRPATSSKKNTPLSNGGAVNSARDTLQLAYIAVTTVVLIMLNV